MKDLAAPRVPDARLQDARYESHYLTAVDPEGGRAVWLRHTALKRPGESASPTVWLTSFDRSAARPVALRVTASEPVAQPGSAYARSSLGEFGPGWARGAIEAAAWDLRWTPGGPEVPYLPARWLYDRPLPRAGGVALVPATTVTGTVTLPMSGAGTSAGQDQAEIELDSWDGMVGHNWGSEHAEQWAWLHAGGLGEARDAWFDLALARVRIGPVLTPWLAAGAVALDGRLRRPSRRGRVALIRDGERTVVSVPLSGGERLELELTAPSSATVGWDYASPAGRGREVEHCSVADASARLGSRRWVVAGRASVEHGWPAPA
jgi:hypothetical protein